ncbi:hypothetical protein RWA06_31790 (plasmid) [Sinorhizobium meliloti]|uniref:hypothetical protein n=1 Tax=Rhizobium meliloti TaxID=382 RepID=UPI00299E7BE2
MTINKILAFDALTCVLMGIVLTLWATALALLLALPRDLLFYAGCGCSRSLFSWRSWRARTAPGLRECGWLSREMLPGCWPVSPSCYWQTRTGGASVFWWPRR